MEVACLSLTQPWASLVVNGLKRVETRAWAYRGVMPTVLAIHATSKVYDQMPSLVNDMAPYGEIWRDALTKLGCVVQPEDGWKSWRVDCGNLPLKAVLGVTWLADCLPTTDSGGSQFAWVGRLTAQERAFGDFSYNRQGWLLERFLAFPEPAPCRGAMSVWRWTVSDHLRDVVARFRHECRA